MPAPRCAAAGRPWRLDDRAPRQQQRGRLQHSLNATKWPSLQRLFRSIIALLPMHVPAVKPQRPAQIVSQAGPTRVANTRQRSPKPTASMQCAQNVLHQWPVARSNSMSGPFGIPHSVQLRFLTLLTVTRLLAGLITLLLAAGPPCPVAQSPFLSLFAVHTSSTPASIPRHPALVGPAMTEDLCARLAPTCGKNELLQPLV
jgi:hypothetical protein